MYAVTSKLKKQLFFFLLSSIGIELTATCKISSLHGVEIHRIVAQQVDSKFVESSNGPFKS
jgi:hypothetical protein